MSDSVKKENDKKKGRILPQKGLLFIRLIVGAYLLYTSYSLIDSVRTNAEGKGWLFLIFIVLFTICGIFLIILSGKQLKNGEYAGGAMDEHVYEEETVDAAAEIQSEPEVLQETVTEGDMKEE